MNHTEIVNGIARSKLLVTIVVDNSSSMKGEKIRILKDAIHEFKNKVNAMNIDQYLEYSLIIYDGLHARELKSFTELDFDTFGIVEGGLALLDRSIELGIDSLTARRNELESQRYDLYKPWFILLTDGQAFASIEAASQKLKQYYREGKLSYFPFALSRHSFDERLDVLKKVKMPLTVRNHQYDKLFEWIFDTIKKRITTPISEGIKLESNCFDGWTVK